MRHVLTDRPLLIDHTSARVWLKAIMRDAQEFLNEAPQGQINLEWFSRLLALTIVQEAANLVGEDELGVATDLKKWVAYGLTNGCLDAMLLSNPEHMQREYSDRAELDLN